MISSAKILTMTVGEVVAHEPTAARVLGLYRIDLCRCAALALHSAAMIAGANPREVARGVQWARSERERALREGGTRSTEPRPVLARERLRTAKHPDLSQEAFNGQHRQHATPHSA